MAAVAGPQWRATRTTGAMRDSSNTAASMRLFHVRGRIVTRWRRWLDRHGGPTWAPGAALPPAQPLPKTVLLDRYDQHTKYCPHCQKVCALLLSPNTARMLTPLCYFSNNAVSHFQHFTYADWLLHDSGSYASNTHPRCLRVYERNNCQSGGSAPCPNNARYRRPVPTSRLHALQPCRRCSGSRRRVRRPRRSASQRPSPRWQSRSPGRCRRRGRCRQASRRRRRRSPSCGARRRTTCRSSTSRFVFCCSFILPPASRFDLVRSSFV